MKLLSFFIFIPGLLLLISCETPNNKDIPADALAVLEATRNKLQTTPTHRYRFTSWWDNRYARSTWADTMSITYSWLPDSELGFGFFAEGIDSDILYDGKDELKIDHNKRKVIRTTAAEISKKPGYFTRAMCFHGDPKALPEAAAVNRISDTIFGGKKHFVYSTTTSSPAGNNQALHTLTTREYYLDPEQEVVARIRNFSHTGKDTSQIIDYLFSDYHFSDEQHVFGAADRAKSLTYREISKADDKQERQSGLIRPGAQLYRADYTDIKNQEQLIYGEAERKTIIMFGFIGCAGCEHAFREMKKKEFAVKEGVALVYSSPVNEASALAPYLEGKGFPFTGFGKESRMNENFNVAGFPTFVLISEEGGVERVIGGYDEEVAGLLFE